MKTNEQPDRSRVVGWGCLAALLIVAGCTTPRDTAVTPTRWDQTRLCASLQLAEEHLAAGKFERARGVLAPFEGLADPRLQLTRARMDVEEGQYEAALRRLDSVARVAPASRRCEGGTYHRLRGIALEGLGRWGEAAKEYEQSFRLDPSVDVFAAWLDALVLDGEPTTAASILERERHRFPGQLAVHLLAARLSERIGDNEAAIAELATAALAEPGSLEVRRRLAELYTAAGRYSEAITSWQQLVGESHSADERRQLQRRLARCLMSAERFEEARRVFRALAVTEPDDLAAQLGLSVACLMVGDPGESLAAALKVLRAEGNNADARLLAALSYRRLGQRARAVELLSDVRGYADPDGRVRELRARWE
ncbi:MAG: tetratricopeptide repeat protein [Planctomycetes bacterium]|nr:tetratricopeptide repeat protein [Planctomycetota bacterium]